MRLEMSEGKFSIGPASLYTSIKKLLDTELIKLTEIIKKLLSLENFQEKFI